MRAAWGRMALLLLLSSIGSGCALLSPVPVWELTKGASHLASNWLGKPAASDTVKQGAFRLRRLCIVFNRSVQAPDVVAALQAEFWEHKVDSRVVEAVTAGDACDAWLTYSASIDWDIPPLQDTHKAYLSAAALALSDVRGQLLASSRYAPGNSWREGKWLSTRRKVAPVVTALLTGVDA